MAIGTKKESSPFQLFVFGAFLLFAAIGVVMFALYQASNKNQAIGTVTVWGTIPATKYDTFLEEYRARDIRADAVQYTYKSPETFDSELVNALASGVGPDMVLITNEQIMRNKARMYVTPYDMYPVRTFKDAYVEAAEVLLLEDGLIGRPTLVDPLVLYWNRTLLANEQFVLPPKQWEELFKMAQTITKRDASKNVLVSGVALGEFSNVNYAKNILVTMFMQAGGTVIHTDATGATEATLTARSAETGTQPMQDALRFYTEFSNPSKSTYSWNRALPNSRDAFIAGDLALYIGYASELDTILVQNPNLNFDVAPLPQTSGGAGERRLTTARVYAYAVPKIAKNVYGASQIIEMFSTPEALESFSRNVGLPSPHRGILSKDSGTDPVVATFRVSAMQAVSWPDPDPDTTNAIFAKMSNNVVDGSMRLSEAVERAQQELSVYLENNQ